MKNQPEFQPEFILLRNEACLFQHCLKSSFVALRKANSNDLGHFYVALFNYSVGLERLMKILLHLEHKEKHGTFQDSLAFKKQFNLGTGHELEPLFNAVESLYQEKNISVPTNCLRDGIDIKILHLLHEFAVGARYFNLDVLTKNPKGMHKQNPLSAWDEIIKEVIATDIPLNRKLSSEDQVDAHVARISPVVVSVDFPGLDGKKQSFEEMCHEENRISLAVPAIQWRLGKILVPMQELLSALLDASLEQFPRMDECLDFVCEEKEVFLSESNWKDLD